MPKVTEDVGVPESAIIPVPEYVPAPVYDADGKTCLRVPVFEIEPELERVPAMSIVPALEMAPPELTVIVTPAVLPNDAPELITIVPKLVVLAERETGVVIVIVCAELIVTISDDVGIPAGFQVVEIFQLPFVTDVYDIAYAS